MPPQMDMDVGGLPGPAGRLEALGCDLSLLHDEIGDQTHSASGACGSPRVVSAVGDFRSAMQAALRALGEDTGILSQNVYKAKVSYQSADEGSATVTALT